MAEYIEREDLIENLNRFAPDDYNALINELIAFQPAADVVPVVHGRWKVYETETYLGSTESGKDRYVTNKIFYCDQCGKGTVIKSRFCAHCGAKMDGGQDGCI